MATSVPQRPITLLPELERLLSTRSASVSDAIRRTVTDVRPCVRLVTTRVSGLPLQGKLLDRLFGKPAAAPMLPATASKFGGIPYAEAAAELDGARVFLGQINFADAARELAEKNFPIPDGMPSSGLLAVDLTPELVPAGARTRWYPDPTESKAVRSAVLDSVGKYEASIQFAGSWSMRGLEYFDAVSEDDDDLWNYINDLEVAGVDEDGRSGHKLFGHPNEALNEHYGLKPVAGRSENIRDYALIWRIDFDHAARFSWGTNWLYVVIHKDDLARGAFENAIVTGANA